MYATGVQKRRDGNEFAALRTANGGAGAVCLQSARGTRSSNLGRRRGDSVGGRLTVLPMGGSGGCRDRPPYRYY
jgi:hypothetical protein